MTTSKLETLEHQEKKKEVLTTEYLDLYYITSFDTGSEVDTIKITEKILDFLADHTTVAAFILVPLPLMKSFEEKRWKRMGGIGVWVKPYTKVIGELPSDVSGFIKQRILSDILIFAGEYLSKIDYARIYLGDITIKFSEQKESSIKKLGNIRGYVELFVHHNGVFVITIIIPIYDIPLSSRDVIRIRYLLEVDKVLVEIPSIIYNTWLKLKIGRESELSERKKITIRTTVREVMEMYSIFIKKLVIEYKTGKSIKDLSELESNLRNPWDVSYTVLFTEILKGEKKIIDTLSSYSTQIYTMMYGTRRIVSKKALTQTLKRSFYFVPLDNIGKTSKLGYRQNITRVTVLVTEANAHIIAISRKYLGPTEIGYRLRLKHLTVFELLNHIRQSLRVIEHLTLKKPRNLDELVDLKEKFSYILDLAENSYFIIDKDMKELYEYAAKIMEINRLILRVERRLDALNYMIMTRYQDKINKMQMALTMLFGIFGVPFFIFSYVQWYFDYVATGKSPNFWPVTIATFAPTIFILMITIFFYYKWKSEIFRYRPHRTYLLKRAFRKKFRR